MYSTEVVHRSREPGGGWQAADSAVRAELVVVLEPPWQLPVAAVGRAVRDGIGPVLEHGLDEALGFAVGLQRIGAGPALTQAA